MFILLLACATSSPDNSTYQGYDPAAEAPATPAEAAQAVRAAEVVSPWFADHNKTFIGFTAPSIGRVVTAGVEPGYASADALCAQMGEAHLCSYEELQKASAAGEFANAPIGRTFWVSLKRGVDDRNCNQFTYPTADQKGGNHGNVVAGANGNVVNFTIAEAVPYDKACERDINACPAVVATGFECNLARSLPCCAN